MRLCDWCDQPTRSDEDELCPKCARAREVEANAGTFIEQVKTKPPAERKIDYCLTVSLSPTVYLNPSPP
jgi:hypothetical protein